MSAPLDLTGLSFNKLTVLRLSSRTSSNGGRYWECGCQCGNTVVIRSDAIQSRSTRSCGCSRVVALKARATHASSGSPEYRTWLAMKQRCHNPNAAKYYMYGAKGIVVCEEWLNSFEQFLSDMGTKPSNKHSIERKDGTQGYTQHNCVWATPQEQSSNIKTNRRITFQGRELTLSQWGRETGIPIPTLINRLDFRGMTVEEAFTSKPFQRHKSSKRPPALLRINQRKPMKQLYLIRADTEHDDNADLFVRANSPADAVAVWKGYCADQGWEVRPDPDWVGAIPDQPTQGVIPWETIERTYP